MRHHDACHVIRYERIITTRYMTGQDEQKAVFSKLRGQKHLTEEELVWNPNGVFLQECRRSVVADYATYQAMRASLVSRFAVIGILNRFNESLKLFDQAYGLGMWNEYEQNADKLRETHGSENSDKTLKYKYLAQLKNSSELLKYIEYDIGLYKEAEHIFERQVAAAKLTMPI